MKRQWLFALAMLATPVVTAGQIVPVLRDEGWGPRVRVTPFVGFSPGFKSAGNLAVYTGRTADIVPDRYAFDYAPGPVSGLGLEVRLYGRFSALASGAWSSRGHTEFTTEDGDKFQDAGSDFYLVRAGGAMRFREGDPDLQLRRLNASLFLAGAMIREDPETTLLSASAFTSPRNHWGVNFGVEAELPLTNRALAFHTTFEDFVVFWDEVAIQERLFNAVREKYGREAVAEVDADHSHLWVVRLGLSFRFLN